MIKLISGKRICLGSAPTVLTIGVFDGVHIGHKEIIRSAVAAARRRHFKAALLTFDPHPAKVLGRAKDVPTLISFSHRVRLIRQLGIDCIAVMPFSRRVSRMSAEEFVKNVVVGAFRAKEVFVGENFYFGRGGRADINELGRLAKKYGFRMKAVRSVKSGGRVVSSSAIRRAIVSGRLFEASRLLGRPVSILGTVVRGARLATKALGYPTANINPHHEVVPPVGVYAVKVLLGARIFKGVLNIGFRPTFYGRNDKEPSIEVHIFGFRGNLYGRDAELEFAKRIRGERHFKDALALAAQIKKDSAKAFLALK